MRPEERERGRLRAKLGVFQRRLSSARAIIAEGLALAPDSYVAFSVGKDSGVVLDLVREQQPEVEARFLRWPETALIDDYDHVIAAWRSRGAHIRELSLTRDRSWEANPDKWRQLAALTPTAGLFLGLRKDESRVRAMSLGRYGPIHRLADGRWRFAPIWDWSTEDVLAWTVTRDLPLLDAYRRHGIETRTTSRIIARDQYSIRENMLRRLREDNPVAYAALRNIYPDLESPAP